MSAAATALARKPALHPKEREATAIALQRFEEQGWERDRGSDQFVYLEALEHRADERDARIAALERQVSEMRKFIERPSGWKVPEGIIS